METIRIFPGEGREAVKPMNAVNNGPVAARRDQTNGNFELYEALEIPFARNHDASYCSDYGGYHTVDVDAVFPDFDADPDDPASYDFVLTDIYTNSTSAAGTETFYRLGAAIEHTVKKYRTLPPKDFHKWAVVCEHIIRHFNEGWADGFHLGLRYWEIWNEADLDPDDSKNKRTWGGTMLQFFDLYEITAKHLKSCFPDLMIGGPAVAQSGISEWKRGFLTEMKKRGAPVDFFSWHIYAADPKKVVTRVRENRAMLDEYGYAGVKSILNEWNYVCGWHGEDWLNSIRAMTGQKGASYAAAVMCACQPEPVDMLMYYDARPGGMNGFFDTDIKSETRPTYYAYLAFRDLRRLGQVCRIENNAEDVYALAATNGNEEAMLLTFFRDDTDISAKKVTLASEKPVTVEIYAADGKKHLELVDTVTLDGKTVFRFEMELYGVYLLKFRRN